LNCVKERARKERMKHGEEEYPMIIGGLRVWLRRHKVKRTGAMMGPRGTT